MEIPGLSGGPDPRTRSGGEVPPTGRRGAAHGGRTGAAPGVAAPRPDGAGGAGPVFAEAARTMGTADGDDTVSVQSGLADRPGVCNPPDTLSVSLTDASDRDGGAGRIAFVDLSRIALAKGFNLHVNLQARDLDPVTRAFQDQHGVERVGAGGSGRVRVLDDRASGATFTFVGQDRSPPHWPEDSLFYGRTSTHVRSPAFSYRLESDETILAITDRRRAAWSELGIADIGGVSRLIGYSNEQGDQFRIPRDTAVFSHGGDTPGLRLIPTRPGIEMGLDGGNMISNGAGPGQRCIIMGLDTVAVTQRYLALDGRPTDAAGVRAHIEAGLNLVEGDRLILVEQPSYHLDMVMMFCGANEVILNDTRGRVFEDHRTDLAGLSRLEDADHLRLEALSRLEGAVARELEAQGVTVHRKPWAGIDTDKRPGETGIRFSFFNGEFVTTQDGGLVYVTNGTPPREGAEPGHIARREAGLRDFLTARDIDLALVPGESAARLFALGGGIGCQANGILSQSGLIRNPGPC